MRVVLQSLVGGRGLTDRTADAELAFVQDIPESASRFQQSKSPLRVSCRGLNIRLVDSSERLCPAVTSRSWVVNQPRRSSPVSTVFDSEYRAIGKGVNSPLPYTWKVFGRSTVGSSPTRIRSARLGRMNSADISETSLEFLLDRESPFRLSQVGPRRR